MRNKRFLSFVTAVAISASVVSGMVLNAEAKSTVYTWDFTDTSYFGEEIAMGSDIISDQNETDAILSNPGARFSVADGKATDDSGNSVRVAKTEAQVTNAVSIKVPAGDSAELSIELTAGSSNRELSLKAEGSDAKVLTAVDYTKNVLKEYTASLDCGTTYYLDTTEYKAYIGKVTLTVKTDGEDDPQPTEKATEKATEAATEKATEAASAAPAPEGLTGLTSDISLNFNDESNKTFSENTVICGGYMRVYATSDKTVNVDASKKTIGGTAYTTRMKMVGAGTADGENSVRALEVYPSVNGTIQVDFAHASSSGDPRDIAVTQNGSTKTQSVDSNSTASIIVNVTAGASVYIYGMANINIYGVKFTAGGEAPTAAPATEKPTMPPGPSELTPITEDAAFNFNDYNNLTFSTNTVVCGGYVKIYAASGSTVNVDNSNKTIDGTKYTTRLKMNGAGKVNGESSTRVIGVMPGVNGQIQVDFAHASGSGDARQLALDQGGSTETQSVDGGATASLIATVKAGEMVYIYGLAGVNLYGIRFTALGELPTVDPNATPTPAPTPTPSPTPEPDLMKMDYKMLFTFADYSSYSSITKPTILGNEDGDPCLQVLATSSKGVAVGSSSKTINGTSYKYRLRLNGAGSVANGERVVKLIPAYEGSLTIDYGHSSSSGDPRSLYCKQGNVVQEDEVAANSTKSVRFIVGADEPIYLYGSGDIGFYGIKYVPNDTATEPPSSIIADPKEATAADAASLKLNSLSQSAIYFDIDLPKAGANETSITWESSNSKYIDVQMVSAIQRNYTGIVTRPEADDPNIVNGGVPVTLTATISKGDVSVKKQFEVSVRTRNPNVYFNDFQQDVGMPAEGDYKAIQDNVMPATTTAYEKGESWRSAPFRGIRVDTLKESRAFANFNHNDKDTSAYFDKRVMSTKGTSYGNPKDSAGEEENFVFYYSEYTPYGGSSTIPMWVELTDQNTGMAPEGIVMMSMDIYVINGYNQFNIGLANSSPSQMCRFMLGADHNKEFVVNGESYIGASYLRSFNSEASVDFLGGNAGYRVPENKWIKAIIVANSDSHKWDLYFDGMQIATGLNFRNAEDCVSNIEFVLNRSYPRADSGDPIAVYLMDNIYVENLTDDYSESYWDELGIDSLPYDKATDTYTAEAGKPFLLQYQGTDGLSGNYITWVSSNTNALSVRSQRIAIDKLASYGYTEEQIAALRAQGVDDVAVVVATPGNVTTDTKVTLRATITVGETELEKEFTILVKANTSVVPTPTPNPNPGNPGGGGGGGGSTTTKPAAGASSGSIATSNNTAPVTATSAPETIDSSLDAYGTFTDLVKTEWAREAVMYLYSKDVVDGYGNGLYGVNDSLTREQFVKMLLNALNIKLYKHETTSFSDIEEGAWYEYYVETAIKLGIVNGISDTEFGTGQPISRQDMAVMAKRAIDLVNSKPDEVIDEEIIDDEAVDTDEIAADEEAADETTADEEAADETAADEETAGEAADETVADTDETGEEAAEDDADADETETEEPDIEALIAALSFNDTDEIADYALAAVAEMAADGILTGNEEGSFLPRKNSTRAETAVMVYRIMMNIIKAQ